MPKIIFADQANNSIADSLKSLGESMFGDQAKQSLIRESAIKGRRQNDAAERGAQALRENNQVEMNAQTFRSNPDSTAMGSQNLARQSIVPGMQPDSPELQVRQIGAHEPASATFMGEREGLAQKDRAQRYASDRAASTQTAIADRAVAADERKDNSTFVTIQTPNGPQQITKREALDRRARGEDIGGAPLHKDQVVGGILQQYYKGGGQPQTAAPRAALAPGAPPASPFDGMPNDIKAAAGLPHMSEEQLRAHGLDEQARNGIPNLDPLPTQFPQSARDNEAGGGILAAGKNIAAHTINAVTGYDPAPDLHASLNNSRNLAARTRALPISGVAKDSVAREKWANENIPQPNTVFGTVPGGGEAARDKTMALLMRLRRQYDTDAALARDPSVPPAKRASMIQGLTELKGVIDDYQRLPGSATPGAPAPAAQPAQAEQAQPPAGFKQAPDGQFYAPDPSRPGKFVMWKP